MNEQKNKQKIEARKRVTTKFKIRAEDNLKIEQITKTLTERGLRRDKVKVQNFILDKLFLKADSKFYESIISELTPLEHLFKESLKNPVMKKEMEKILKKKNNR